MPESVKQCVTSVMEEENISESDAYAVCWSKFNEGELKEDDNYEWGPYNENDEDEEEEDIPVKDKIRRKAHKIYEEHDDIDKEGARAVSFATIAVEEAGFKDKLGVQTVAYKTVTDEWPGIHPSETLSKGRRHLIKTYKYVVDKILGQGEVAKTLSKSDTMEKINFTADFAGTQTVFKSGDDFIIWGPASVEVVDKEGDRIHAEALEDALPQLLKRGRLSLEHSDQLVGKIIESFEIEEDVKLEIDGETYKRKDFPTDVLEHNGRPALFVCGKIYDDTRQSRRVRESIENGELNSYSISGEALVSRNKIENGEPVNDIVELDLSAVTVCEEGMNQAAKFATVKKQDSDQESDKNVLTVKSDSSEISISKSDDANTEKMVEHSGNRTVKISNYKTMSDETQKGEDSPTEITLDELTGEFQNVVKEALQDESFVKENDVLGKEDVEEIVNDLVQEKMDEAEQSSEEDVEKSDEESESITREDVESIAKEIAKETASSTAEEAFKLFKEEYEDEEEEEKAEEDEEEEEKANHDDEEEEEKDVRSGKQSEEDLASAIAEMTGADEDDALSALEDLSNKEDDDEMDEEEKASEDEMDEEEEEKGDYEDDDDEEEKTGGSQYTVSELKEKLPEDVFDAVRGYIGEEKAEKSQVEETGISDLDIDAAVEKAIGEKFETAESPEAPTSDVEKSYGEDEEEIEVENPALSLWRNN